MLTFPNAKVNIGLYITGKRTDGYHDLETLFYPVKLTDALEFIDHNVAATEISLSGLPVAGSTESNLVWKAYHLLQNDFPGKIAPLHIYLHKTIPMGGGMGGGSSDGAFMLRMLNEHFELGLSVSQLEKYALQLGSDCPFFIRNRPAFASGRGERLEPIDLDLSAYTIQLICPGIHVSTAAAFKGIQPAAADFDLHRIAGVPIHQWKEHIRNDFEQPVFGQYPVLNEIKTQLYEQGAIYASMSGSGASLYGIFERGKYARPQADIPFTTYLST